MIRYEEICGHMGISMSRYDEIRGSANIDEKLPGSSWHQSITCVIMAGMSCERLGLCSPTPVMFDVSPEMQSNVSQEIQRDFRSHKSIAATLTNPFSKILTKPGVRRLFHTLLPLPLLLDELSAPNSLSMFQAKGCERTNDFI